MASSDAAGVTFEDVERAAGVLAGIAHETPVHRSRYLDSLTGAHLFLKCENFQRTGAFKFRGAYNAIHNLAERDRSRGVLTYSSGNHAQALSLSGSLLETRVTVIMPQDAPEIKKSATLGYGAEIILYDKYETTREALAEQISAERGLPVIPPYNHVDVIAGQGTAAREFHRQQPGLDLLLVPCGGGGLLSGTALSTRALNPGCRIVGVEPAAADDATRSFRSGSIQTVDNPDTIADGARTPFLGDLTFPIIMDKVDEMVTVQEDSILQALSIIWERMKLIVEPTAVLGLAAILEGNLDVSGKQVGIMISGGNVDIRSISTLLGAATRSTVLPAGTTH